MNKLSTFTATDVQDIAGSLQAFGCHVFHLRKGQEIVGMNVYAPLGSTLDQEGQRTIFLTKSEGRTGIGYYEALFTDGEQIVTSLKSDFVRFLLDEIVD